MKILTINGSPRGEKGNTHQMVKAFSAGAEKAGAQVTHIFLAEKKIGHCRGCFNCWFKTPGKCIIKDDMEEINAVCADADILLLASPLYVDNITGLMKDFIDRRVMNADPHFNKDNNGECRHFKRANYKAPKLIFMSNCGFPERSHFQAVSLWIKRAALNMKAEILGEFYTSQGSLLQNHTFMLKPILYRYFKNMAKAGEEAVTRGEISEETKQKLSKKFIPDEVYIKHANKFFDDMLAKIN
ncbi:flavodoxin family protein [Pectinatus sottacetonis]|uniref:flavodoxin family protein n=1 Tax=Pectinatus sottacetonis TaxID=1002795 RepID=UPI0018C47C61|nr:flavodoxin family protein [Pectinatus sottacetonis]